MTRPGDNDHDWLELEYVNNFISANPFAASTIAWMAIGPPWISFDFYAGHRWSFAADSREKNLKPVCCGDEMILYLCFFARTRFSSFIHDFYGNFIVGFWIFGVLGYFSMWIRNNRNRILKQNKVESENILIRFQFGFDLLWWYASNTGWMISAFGWHTRPIIPK